MVDHILSMETKIIDFCYHDHELGGIIALDIKAAFPSLSRRYMFWVLSQMRVPRRLIYMFKRLHTPSLTFICLRSRLYDSFRVSRGVKQGDPAAMALFVLAYDPIIRFISFSISIDRTYSYGFCDDLAIATVNLKRTWQRLCDCFTVIGHFAALELNADKTQFLITRWVGTNAVIEHSINTLIADMISSDSSLSRDQFVSHIKYLGVLHGLSQQDCNWDKPLVEYLDTCKFIASLDCGLTTKISLYNMLAFSKLSYVGSLFDLSKKARDIEINGIQRIMSGS